MRGRTSGGRQVIEYAGDAHRRQAIEYSAAVQPRTALHTSNADSELRRPRRGKPHVATEVTRHFEQLHWRVLRIRTADMLALPETPGQRTALDVLKPTAPGADRNARHTASCPVGPRSWRTVQDSRSRRGRAVVGRSLPLGLTHARGFCRRASRRSSSKPASG